MKSKLSLGLTAALGSAALVASALAQQQPDLPAQSTTSTSSSVPADSGQPSVRRDPFSSADAQLPSLPANLDGTSLWADQPARKGRSVRSEAGYLGQTVDKLAHALVEAKSDSERDKLKNQLTETLEKVFDLRQKRHAKEIADLEAQVKKLKDMVQRRQENRRDIVAKKLDQIVSDFQGLGW
jgi:hypothetical protein